MALTQKNFFDIARICATASHCQVYKVGAVLVKNNRVVSTGINGSPSGHVNCNSMTFQSREEHSKWSMVNEQHAEVNCLNSAYKNGIQLDGTESLFSTVQPCQGCLKALAFAGIKNIYYSVPYDRVDYSDPILSEFILHNNLNIQKE